MTYRGMMDGWNGDENDCHGFCGLCDYCEELFYKRCDEEYDECYDEM